VTVKTILNKTNDQVYQFLLGEVLRPDGFTQTIEFPINKNITIYCVAPKWQEEKGESYRERYHKAWLNLTDFIVNITMRCIADVYQGHPLYIDRDAKLEKIGTFLGAAIKNKHVAETEVPFANIKQRPEKAHVSANQSASTSAIDNPLVSINTTLFTVETTGKHCLSIKLIDEPKSVTSEPEAYIISSSYNGLLCCSSENKEVTGLCKLEVQKNITHNIIKKTSNKIEQDIKARTNEELPKLIFQNEEIKLAEFYDNHFENCNFESSTEIERATFLSTLIKNIKRHSYKHQHLSINKSCVKIREEERSIQIQRLCHIIQYNRTISSLHQPVHVYTNFTINRQIKGEFSFEMFELPNSDNKITSLCFRNDLDKITLQDLHTFLEKEAINKGITEVAVLIDLSQIPQEKREKNTYGLGSTLLKGNNDTAYITKNKFHVLVCA